MDRTRVFYHVGGVFGKSRMDSQDRQPDSGPPVPSLPRPEANGGYVAQPPSPPLLHSVFLGPAGLRVPWRIALYLIIGGILVIVLGAVTSRWHARGTARLWQGVVFELDLAIAAIAPALVMMKIERRPFRDYGLPGREAFGKLFWVGAVWGIVFLTGLMLVMRSAHLFYFGGVALHGFRIYRFAAYYALFFVVVGFFEEFLARGYLQFTLAQGIGFWPAAIVLSMGFGLLHLGNSGEAWLGIAAAAFIGLFFCLTLYRTGSLWWAIGFHTSWDWGETYLYSVPNSGTVSPGHLLSSSFHGSPWLTGGSVGPEGSVLVFVLIAVMWIAFDRAYPKRRWRELRQANGELKSQPVLRE